MTDPATKLLGSAADRLRPTHADWARAMLAEAQDLPPLDRLRWAAGCWLASLRLSPRAAAIVYAAALPAGLALMAAYEWSADESRATLFLLALIAACLGALRPHRATLSGALVGLVVAAIIGFEAATGIRPGYEAHAQTLAGAIHWLALLAPALSAACLGAALGRRLRPTWPLP